MGNERTTSMARKVFVDTGAWVGLADRSDDLHEPGRAAYATILQPPIRLVTTNLVVAESYALIRRRIGYEAAMRFLQSLQTSPRLEKVLSDWALERDAEAILRRYTDQDFSYVDAVSFAVMRAQNITEVFGFDGHFRIMGFVLRP